MSARAAPVIAAQRRTFRAVATAVVPEATMLDEKEWREVERIIETALADRPARLQRQLALLLRVIEHLPRFRHATRFSHLTPVERQAVLERLQDSRVLLLRRGFWGLRTLVLMGYYARDAAAAEVGYRAHTDGWTARRGRDAAKSASGAHTESS